MTTALDPVACYAAMKTHDTRFDGQFFVGVSSTHIYCRPVCHAKLPKFENCTFFRTAAEAESAGYRPCLQCRPETAPGRSTTDAVASLAQRAARAIEDECATIGNLDDLAGRLGYTDRHLRRAFESEYQVTPQQYLQTCRLLLAKNLLTETSLPVSEVATACGFNSVRRFNDAFKQQYRMPPTHLRQKSGLGANAGGQIVVTLGYRPPYAWKELLQFLELRAIPGVERVVLPEGARSKVAKADKTSTGSTKESDDLSGSYARVVRLPKREGGFAEGWISVERHPRRDALVLRATDSLAPVLPQVIMNVKNLFDLRCQPEAVVEGLSSLSEIDKRLPIRGLRVPGCFEPFEMSVRAVLGQQITVKAASTMAGRIATTLGHPVETGEDGLACAFPTAEDMLALGGDLGDKLGQLGVIRTRQRTIRELAEAFSTGAVDCSYGADAKEQMASLRALPGIGDWTAQYIAMRAMRYADAFPATDLGVKKTLAPRTEKQIRELAQQWSPWRAYATLNLWNVEPATETKKPAKKPAAKGSPAKSRAKKPARKPSKKKAAKKSEAKESTAAQ